MTFRCLFAIASVSVAFSVSAPARAAKPVFDGEWSVRWCDRGDPKAECGGFFLSLVQHGDRLCGSYDGARVRLSQLDEGDARAIHGVAIGRDAVLTIESARSGDIHLVRAAVRGDAMHWRIVDTVHDADGDIDVLAYDNTLKRQAPKAPVSERRAGVPKDCAPEVRAVSAGSPRR